MADPLTERARERHDRLYWSRGPCCAGCDWWRSLNSVAGLCQRAAPVGGDERASMIGISGCSLPIGAGHPLTMEAHVCGDFRDEFDWSSLPLAYRKRVGALSAPVKGRDGETSGEAGD